MKREAVDEAVGLLAQARETGRLLTALPDACHPTTLEEAHVLQAALAANLGERIAGWKVMITLQGEVVRGAIVQSRVVASGATLPASKMPLLGVEAEIAFRFDRALAPRSAEYDYREVADAVTAFIAIEVVDSRYSTYPSTPLYDRVADFMSNGAFVVGASVSDWRTRDLTQADVELAIDGATIVRKVGGHPARDPLLPAIALVNDLRTQGIDAGSMITTGTYTGLNHAKRGQTVEAIFHGIGTVTVHFD